MGAGSVGRKSDGVERPEEEEAEAGRWLLGLKVQKTEKRRGLEGCGWCVNGCREL